MFDIDPERLEGFTKTLEDIYQKNKGNFENPTFIDGCHYGAYITSLYIIKKTIDVLLKTEDLNPTLEEMFITAKGIHLSSGLTFGRDDSDEALETIMQPLIDHVNKCDASYERKGFRTPKKWRKH